MRTFVILGVWCARGTGVGQRPTRRQVEVRSRSRRRDRRGDLRRKTPTRSGPIASTTKIFVAMAIRKKGLDLDGWTEITKADAQEAKGGARTRLDVGRDVPQQGPAARHADGIGQPSAHRARTRRRDGPRRAGRGDERRREGSPPEADSVHRSDAACTATCRPPARWRSRCAPRSRTTSSARSWATTEAEIVSKDGHHDPLRHDEPAAASRRSTT